MIIMKTLIYFLMAIVVVLFQAANNASGQTRGEVSQKTVQLNLVHLKSNDYEKRLQAANYFDQLSNADLNPEIFKAAIDALKQEIEQTNGIFKIEKSNGSGEAEAEAYGMYMGSLCNIIGKSNNKEALPLLVDRCMSSEGLLRFGDDAAILLLNVLTTNSNDFNKTNAISILGVMLQPKTTGYVATGEVRSKIKKTLIQTLSANDLYIKMASVRAIGNSEDKDMQHVLENIANNDGVHFLKKDKATGKEIDRYPVREEAKKALMKFKSAQ